jgi:ribulose 1,5-bisphosphate synthetase/thiazole synthase
MTIIIILLLHKVILFLLLFCILTTTDGGTFDYVIVGAGPGASLAASELSKHNSVLMIETGKNIF